MNFYNLVNDDYQKIVRYDIIKPFFKIELLDHQEQAYSELIDDISTDQAGSISIGYKQGVRKTISFSIFDTTGKFIPNANNKYFWINKKFKAYIGLSKTRYFSADNPLIYSYSESDLLAYLKYLNPDNWNDTSSPIANSSNDGILKFSGNAAIESEEDIYWFSKGIYIITDISSTSEDGSTIININGVDKFGLFGSETGYNEMIATFSIPKGTKIKKVLSAILNQDTGKGEVLDPIEPIIDPYYLNASLSYDLDKGPGSYLADILSDLANAFRADIFYDNEGHLNFWRSMIGEENANLPSVWDFNNYSPEYIKSSLTYNLVKTTNRVCVVGDNPNGGSAPFYISENRNATSPISIQSIGIKNRYIESSMIQSKKEAKDYADYFLEKVSIQENTIDFESTLIPHLEVNSLFTLTDPSYNIVKESFIIESLTIPIGIGTMKISGSNVKELPTYS